MYSYRKVLTQMMPASGTPFYQSLQCRLQRLRPSLRRKNDTLLCDYQTCQNHSLFCILHIEELSKNTQYSCISQAKTCEILEI